MHLFYVDESGSIPDPQHQHFVLAGVSIFERQTHWVEQKLNDIAVKFSPQNSHDLELHGSPMRAGRDGWKQFPLQERLQAIKDSLDVGIAQQNDDLVRIFSVVIKKTSVKGQDPVEYAFEQLSSRFDSFLTRRYQKFGDPQRGIMLFDKSGTERRIQTLARDFKYEGHTWGKLRNFSEVPVFLDSKASRLIQLADMTAYSIFRHFEYQDSQFFDVIKNKFDKEGNIEHGLHCKF